MQSVGHTTSSQTKVVSYTVSLGKLSVNYDWLPYRPAPGNRCAVFQ